MESGSAGVSRAVCGLWPKTSDRRDSTLFAVRSPGQDRSARRRPERPGRSRSPYPTDSSRWDLCDLLRPL